jgi:hypothetical protein
MTIYPLFGYILPATHRHRACCRAVLGAQAVNFRFSAVKTAIGEN